MPSDVPAAAHTPGFVARLEQLGAATQSGRAVLLEGETCSGKTALVTELARLAQRQLVVVSLTAETGVCGSRCMHLCMILACSTGMQHWNAACL